MSGLFVILGCGATKRRTASPAIDLYVSPYAHSATGWARSVTTPDRILILSAKHGLIDSRTVIEPYDVSFQGPTSDQAVTGETLAAQAEAFRPLGLDGQTVMLAGLSYRSRLMRATEGRIQPVNPFLEELRAAGEPLGIGTLKRAMKNSLGRMPPLDGVVDARLATGSHR